jgi:hypothetical protein
MVEMALAQLQERGIIEFDRSERRPWLAICWSFFVVSLIPNQSLIRVLFTTDDRCPTEKHFYYESTKNFGESSKRGRRKGFGASTAKSNSS